MTHSTVMTKVVLYLIPNLHKMGVVAVYSLSNLHQIILILKLDF